MLLTYRYDRSTGEFVLTRSYAPLAVEFNSCGVLRVQKASQESVFRKVLAQIDF